VPPGANGIHHGSPDLNNRHVKSNAMKWHRAHLLAALFASCVILGPVPPVSAAPAVLEWVEVDAPGDNDLTVVTPSEVTGIAAGHNGVVYAIDGENSRIYRSTNYGLDWDDITRHLQEAGAVLPATLIAVAPDNEGIVAVLASAGTEVYISLDGGMEWDGTRLPVMAAGEEVTSLDISPVYSDEGNEYRDIAVGTASWGDGLSNGDVYILQGGCSWSGWKAQELFVDPGHVGADVAGVSYSNDFCLDRTLFVVCSTGTDVAAAYQGYTWLCPGERDGNSNTTDWDFLSGSGYPLMLSDGGINPVAGDSAAVSYVRASLAQPDGYGSSAGDDRRLFLSVEREPDSYDDVYRIVGDTPVDVCQRMDVDGGTDIDIWSIAYRGDLEDGALLAGERDPIAATYDTGVHRCLNPFESLPDWQESTVPPTGPGRAVLAWAPDVSLVYCGTSSQPGDALDESAFSASMCGDLWRQMALIDTEFTLCDLVVTPDGGDLFLSTSNKWGPESIWQSFSDPLGERWERVLTVDTESDAVMIKLSQEFDEDDTIYVVEHDGARIALTRDRGNSWDWQRNSPEPILDFVVVNEDTLYAAIPGGMVMKSTNHARSWDDPVDAEVDEINMLSLATDGTLFVGGRNGHVSYSLDGAETFVHVKEPVGTGDVQLFADVGFDGAGWVFAATDVSDEGLWRWNALKGCDWQQMDREITLLADGQQIGGLLQGPEGTLYVLRTEPVSGDTGGMTRWLCPTCSPCADLESNHVIEGLPDGARFDASDLFAAAHPVGTLWSNDVETDIFVIGSVDSDQPNQRIWLYRDTLCKRGPDLKSPADGSRLDPNACACNKDAVVAFDWEEFDKVEQYQWQVYLDASLSEPLWSEFSDYEGVVISPWGDTTDFGNGQRYGWRVRATTPVLSPWSPLWSFNSALCSVDNLVPGIGTTDVSLTPVFTWDSPCHAQGFEFMLCADPSYSDVIVEFSGDALLTETVWRCNRTLEPLTDYFWRVRSVRGDALGPWLEGYFRTEAETVTPAPVAERAVGMPAQPADSLGGTSWVLFGLVVALMVALIILVMKTATRR